jgi:hypothetical protein
MDKERQREAETGRLLQKETFLVDSELEAGGGRGRRKEEKEEG